MFECSLLWWIRISSEIWEFTHKNTIYFTIAIPFNSWKAWAKANFRNFWEMISIKIFQVPFKINNGHSHNRNFLFVKRVSILKFVETTIEDFSSKYSKTTGSKYVGCCFALPSFVGALSQNIVMIHLIFEVKLFHSYFYHLYSARIFPNTRLEFEDI